MAADNLIPMVSTPVQQCHLSVTFKMEILLTQQKNVRYHSAPSCCSVEAIRMLYLSGPVD